MSRIQTLLRQSSWPTLSEKACPVLSHDVPGYLQEVVWRLRDFRSTKFPLGHSIDSTAGEQFVINICDLMREKERAWLGMQENN